MCFAVIEYPPDVGGLGRSARRVAGYLVDAGFDVHVVKPLPFRGSQCTVRSVDGAILHELGPGRPGFTSALLALEREHAFDVFHAFGLWLAGPCVGAAAARSRPVIASIRGADGFFSSPSADLIGVLRSAAWITSVSTDAVLRANNHIDVSAKCSFIPNGVDTTGLPRWELTEANRGVVGTVTAFRKKKNIPGLLDAYSRLRPTSRKRLLLVGEVAQHTRRNVLVGIEVRQAMANLGLSREVTITGLVENMRIPEYLRGMNVFVLASDHEGLPNSLLEAAAVGVPLVATAVDGVKDVFASERSALLVPPNDARALADAVQRVLDDEALARRLSAAGRDVAAALTPAVEKRAYLELYARILIDRGAG